MATKPSPIEIANKILSLAKEYGCRVEVRGDILTVTKTFTPGSASEYTGAESDVSSVIYTLPQKSAGSTWGTDGGSIGGMVGMNGGYMKLNRSGGSKLVLKALVKAGA
jgi:hypothetical protein